MTPRIQNAGAVSLLFRAWSPFYDHPLPQRLFYGRVHQCILRRWAPAAGERVLDAGCGTGLLLKTIADRFEGLDLTGLDLSEHMLAQARQKAWGGRSQPRFVRGSVYEMPFPNGAYDIVLNSISCHFYIEQVRAFREMHRVLAPGGRLLCATIVTRLPGWTPLRRIATFHPPAVLEEHFRLAGFDSLGRERVVPWVALYELRKPL